VIATDLDGTITYWNPAAQRTYGWSAGEAIGRRVESVVVPENEQVQAAAIVAQARAGGSWTGEIQAQRRDGSPVPILLTVSPIHGDDGRVTGIIGINVDLTEEKRAEEDRSRLGRTLALLEERDRIAMELHDGSIQALYGTVLSLGAVLRSQPEDSKVRDALGRAIEQLTSVIDDVRTYVHGLGSQVVSSDGLRAGLQALVAQYRSDRLRVDLRLTVDEAAIAAALGPDRLNHVIQIAREAVANAARHAGATLISIRARWSRRRFVLEVRDDGSGLPRDRISSDRGQGMRNMAARAERIGGRVELDSREGAGTVVRLEVPLAGGAA